MMADIATLRLALKLDRQYAAQYQEYVEACEADRRSGYIPHFCEHGTNMWTDYDAICGGCEDGITFRDPMIRRSLALENAKARAEEARAVAKLIADAARMRVAHALDSRAVWDRVAELMML